MENRERIDTRQIGGLPSEGQDPTNPILNQNALKNAIIDSLLGNSWMASNPHRPLKFQAEWKETSGFYMAHIWVEYSGGPFQVNSFNMSDNPIDICNFKLPFSEANIAELEAARP